MYRILTTVPIGSTKCKQAFSKQKIVESSLQQYRSQGGSKNKYYKWKRQNRSIFQHSEGRGPKKFSPDPHFCSLHSLV